MAHRVDIRGVDGELRWGYSTAATLRDFHAIRDGDGWTLTAAISQQDDYAVSQRPLVFIIPARGWRWDVRSLQVADGTVTAVLGPQL